MKGIATKVKTSFMVIQKEARRSIEGFEIIFRNEGDQAVTITADGGPDGITLAPSLGTDGREKYDEFRLSVDPSCLDITAFHIQFSGVGATKRLVIVRRTAEA